MLFLFSILLSSVCANIDVTLYFIGLVRYFDPVELFGCSPILYLPGNKITQNSPLYGVQKVGSVTYNANVIHSHLFKSFQLLLLNFGLPSPCLSLQSSKTQKLPPSQIHCNPCRWQLIIPPGLYCPSPWPSSGITLPCLQEPPQLRLVPLGPPLGSGCQVVPLVLSVPLVVPLVLFVPLVVLLVLFVPLVVLLVLFVPLVVLLVLSGPLCTLGGPPGLLRTLGGPPGPLCTLGGPPGLLCTLVGAPGPLSTLCGPPCILGVSI